MPLLLEKIQGKSHLIALILGLDLLFWPVVFPIRCFSYSFSRITGEKYNENKFDFGYYQSTKIAYNQDNMVNESLLSAVVFATFVKMELFSKSRTNKFVISVVHCRQIATIEALSIPHVQTGFGMLL